jgi:hypothetical protein
MLKCENWRLGEAEEIIVLCSIRLVGNVMSTDKWKRLKIRMKIK